MAKNMLNSWLPDLQLIAAPKSAPMELTLDIPMLLETMMSPMIQLQQPDPKFKLASPANSPSTIELLFQLSCQLFLLLLFKHQGNTEILYGFCNTLWFLKSLFRGKFVVSMDMFSGDDFQEKLDLSNNDVSIAKGDWLHLEMNLRTVVDDGK